MSTQSIIIVLLIVIVLLVLKKQRLNSHSIVKNEPEGHGLIDEERVLKIQTDFEEEIQSTFLPDAIDGKEVYIYKNLMRPWYSKLSSQHRYDESMTQKLRGDWIDYMAALQDRSVSGFLALETDDETKQNSYREDHIIASKKVLAIEDAFAEFVGSTAINELEKIRAMDLFEKFSRHGDMAKDGYRYDANDKLCKIRT